MARWSVLAPIMYIMLSSGSPATGTLKCPMGTGADAYSVQLASDWFRLFPSYLNPAPQLRSRTGKGE
jgi:hypothetical protein